ncbi:hypothetical protein TNCV_3266541 [Trichonephila clavipes]|nr:hypothetical protein TNCV_3266541 [Trichonephila clavipes]
MVSGNKNNDSTPSNNNNNNRSERQSTPRASPSNEINTFDFQDIIDLFKICHGSLVVMAGMLRVQAKYPPCRCTMHIKSVEFKRPSIGVVVRTGEFQLRCRP